MKPHVRTEKLSLVLLLGALLGLFVPGPRGSVFAELDEPPALAEPAGTLGPVLQGDRSEVGGQRMAGLDSGEEAKKTAMMDYLRRGLLFAVSWVLLIVGLMLVALTLWKTYIWLRAVQKARVPPARYFNLLLQVRSRDGELGLYNFDYYPVIVAACGSADLLLPDVEDRRTRFRIDYRQGQPYLLADTSLIVNGVPRQYKPLKQDDRIIFGPYRLVFKDASIQEQSAPVPGKPVFVWQFPIVALLLALAVLFRQAGAVPEDRMLLAKAAELQSVEAVGLAENDLQEPSPVQPAAGVSVAQTTSPEPVTPTQRVRDRKTEEQELQTQNSARVAFAEMDCASKQENRIEQTSPATAEAVASSVPGRREARPSPGAADDSNPSVWKVASSQAFPLREPVKSSEPLLEAAAAVPAPRPVETSSATKAAAPGERRATQRMPVLQASVLAAVSPPEAQNDGINPLEALGFAKARSAAQIGRVKVRVIPPGRSPEYFQADILFIHAHPDDESIDFGSLMAMASRANKRIVTLLFTDGESGLDLYPERKVGDIYPARDLTGGALSQVRVVEAARALSILGSEMYIRWGLENRPYNTKADEVPPEEVIRGWGGDDRLVDRLIEVLEGFRPMIVVSPDRHSRAYEHFEHEAVGQLVQIAVERLRREGGASFLKGHIVSIDPYQVDRYSGVTTVDALATDGQSGLAYREIQALALKEHITQRDAAVIGVSRLSHLPQEFYKTLFWDLDLSLQEYLK
jgi:LmbE family N-acetylglucosaminyl deacetylase